MAFRPGKNNKNILSRIGRKSEGKMGVSDGVWECGKPFISSTSNPAQNMKKIYAFLFLLLLASGAAVQNPTAYFMERSTLRSQFNPAFAPLRGYVNRSA